MRVTELCFGDVINSYWPQLKWYDIPGHQIQRYQRVKYPGSLFWRATHSVIYLGGTRYFEVTAPKARYGDVLDDFDNDHVYTVSRYRYPIMLGERSAVLEVCDAMEGSGYDYGQLLDIAIHQILGWDPLRPLSIFDLGRKRKVCSVGAIACFLRWHELYGKEQGVPKPLGFQDAEVCCPADLEGYNQPLDFRFMGMLERGDA